jgi:hypothetical protein
MDISPKNTTKIISKCTFKDEINRVFDVLINPDIFKDIMKDYLNDIKFFKGNSLGVVGTEYTFNIENKYPIHMIISDVTINANYRKVVHKPLKTSIPLDFEITNNLYWDSIEGTTLYLKEFYVKNSTLPIPITAEEIKKYKLEQVKICNQKKKWLRYSTIGMEQEESINIKAYFEETWRLVSNLKQFSLHMPLSAESVEVLSSNKVRLTKDNFICEYDISIIAVNDFSRELLLTSKGYETAHLLKLIVLKVTEEYSFVSIRHKFLQGIDYKCINKIIDFKKKLLLRLKKELETV